VSIESLWFLLRFLKNQNITTTMAMSPIEPSTPPMTGPGVTRGFDDMPAAADDSSAFAMFVEVADVGSFDAAIV
jgi:hypothetical protein